jgi:DNA-binding transcriptional MerR regulator
MAKSVDAFRTISEVAEWLEVPPHVLRFWESKFSQVKPVKRAGGRRYYRPTDMLLLGGIKVLLHDEGMTIKGVQKLLGEHGVRHVSERSPALDDLTGGAVADMVLEAATETSAPAWERSPGQPGSTRDIASAKDAEEAEDVFDQHAVLPEPATALRSDAWPDAPHEPAVQVAADTRTPATHADLAPEASASTPDEAPPPLPQGICALPDLPADPQDDLPAIPGPLTALADLAKPLTQRDAARLAPFLDRLRHLAGAMAHGRGGRD